jgi:frataxin-like iron-binding protein CyaY
MNINEVLKKLEEGEIVKMPLNVSALNAIQIALYADYHEANIDVDIQGGIMTLTPEGKFISKFQAPNSK